MLLSTDTAGQWARTGPGQEALRACLKSFDKRETVIDLDKNESVYLIDLLNLKTTRLSKIVLLRIDWSAPDIIIGNRRSSVSIGP